MACSDHLPSEIVQNILLRLPTKSLVRFQIVSKSWYANIWNPHFIKLYMDQSRHSQSENFYIAYNKSGFCGFFKFENGLRKLFVLKCPFASPGEEIYLMSSCNGVLLFQIGTNEFVIWNPYPFAQKWTRINFPRADDYSLCYDESRDDLKIVGFFKTVDDRIGCNAYSCKNGTWELKIFTQKYCWPVEQVSFRGEIYWIDARDEHEVNATHIARYNPSSDVLQTFPTPAANIQFMDCESRMTTSKESLYLYRMPLRWYGVPDLDTYLRIWVMKDDYSWEHLVNIDYGDVDRTDWPVYVHFPNGRNDFVIQTEYRYVYSIDCNQVNNDLGRFEPETNSIGKVPEDMEELLINHPMDTLSVSSLSKGVGYVL